jgi:cation diffusion facilitator CzcD-associated flavoprotein CzcO
VIGAGAAGICAGRRLLEDAEKNGTSGLLEVRIFEKTDKIGGTWVLDEEEEAKKEGIEKCQPKDHHSSMYHNLRFLSII